MENERFERIMELASRRSIFYPAAEIYPNSPAGFWDFGPVGQAIRRKIVEVWRHEFVQKESMLEISGAQILPVTVFEGSGHVRSFADPVVRCLKCKRYERADHLISENIKKIVPESLPLEELEELIKKNKIKCPKCGGDFGKASKFKMMVETLVGKLDERKTFLRPEACQSIFLSFVRMVKTMRLKLPQGIAQVGSAFRNEISPRQAITRAVEFSQMECEIFFDPTEIDAVDGWEEVRVYKIRLLGLKSDKIEEIRAEDLVKKKIVPGKLIAYYLARTQQLWNKLGIPLEKMRFREVAKEERAFYSLATFDFEVETSLVWLELIANNYRAEYDLSGHMEHSGTNLEYAKEDGKKLIPHVWEISAGVERTLFAVLDASLKEGKEGDYFALNMKTAPFDCGIFPLVKKDGLLELARKIERELKDEWLEGFFDSAGSIGRRYARADEIGVPFSITVDYESLKEKDVTIRDRDTTKQARVKVGGLKDVLRKLKDGEINFEKL